MSRVLLIQPWNYHETGNGWRRIKWRNGPYPLILLGTILQRAGHNVHIYDMNRLLVYHKGNVAKVLQDLKILEMSSSYDLVAVTLMTMQVPEVARLFQSLYKSHALVVVGGIHATVSPQSCREIGFEHVFCGPGESAILGLADGNIVETGDEIRDLDTLPFLNWDLCDYTFYRHSRWKSLDLMMSRGCIHHCNFCAYSYMEKFKCHSVRYLLDEVDYMKKSFGIESLYITDSSVGNNKRLLIEFCEGMIGKNVSWIANMRSDQVSEALLTLMLRAGCKCLLYGFESGSQRVLDLMNKGTIVDDNYKTAELHRKLNFPYFVSIIKDYPGETNNEWRQTIKMLEKIRPSSIGINRYVALPGSRDWSGSSDWRQVGESKALKVWRIGKWILSA